VAEAKNYGRNLSPYELKRLVRLHSKKIEEYLDSGIGSCVLGNSSIANMVIQSLKHFDQIRLNCTRIFLGGPEARAT
jgi:hypothetical protein